MAPTRPAENRKDSKRAKKKKGEEADGDAVKKAAVEGSKRPLFERLWSEEEEIVILKGIIDYSESFMKEGFALIDCAKRSEWEEKWRKLQVAETEIFLRVIELNRELTKLVLDANKKH